MAECRTTLPVASSGVARARADASDGIAPPRGSPATHTRSRSDGYSHHQSRSFHRQTTIPLPGRRSARPPCRPEAMAAPGSRAPPGQITHVLFDMVSCANVFTRARFCLTGVTKMTLIPTLIPTLDARRSTFTRRPPTLSHQQATTTTGRPAPRHRDALHHRPGKGALAARRRLHF